MKTSHIAAILTLVCLQYGCDQSQVVESCTDSNSEKVAESPIAGEPGQKIGDGGPCGLDDDCVNGACIASTNSFSYGYCYGKDMIGCIVVTEPSPFKAQCAALTKRLYVCGDGEDVTQWGANCASVGDGSFGETYECCDAP